MTAIPTPQGLTIEAIDIGIIEIDFLTDNMAYTRRIRDDIAALLRFRDAMTPEMWDHVAALLRFTMMDPQSEIGARSGAILAALDTLRAALAKEKP